MIQPGNKLQEAGLGSYASPARIETQPDQPVRPFLKSPVEPGESRIGLVQPGVNQSDAVRRYKCSRRELAQLGYRLVSCSRSAANSLSMSASGDGNRPAF